MFVSSTVTEHVSSVSEGMFQYVNPALCNCLLTLKAPINQVKFLVYPLYSDTL